MYSQFKGQTVCSAHLTPSCRKPTQLPDIGPTEFPTAFLINSLLAVLNTSKLLPLNEDSDTKCNDHNEPIKVYCETCQELICRDCTISQRHQNHKYKLITECYPDHYQEIEADLTKVKRKVAVLIQQ